MGTHRWRVAAAALGVVVANVFVPAPAPGPGDTPVTTTGEAWLGDGVGTVRSGDQVLRGTGDTGDGASRSTGDDVTATGSGDKSTTASGDRSTTASGDRISSNPSATQTPSPAIAAPGSGDEPAMRPTGDDTTSITGDEPRSVQMIPMDTPPAPAIRIDVDRLAAEQAVPGDCNTFHALAIRAGWTDAEWPTLLAPLNRETGGCHPDTVNRYGCAGLLQVCPINHARLGVTITDLLDPLTNLRIGKRLYDERGWRPWWVRGWHP